MGKFIDLTGKEFGYWKVLGRSVPKTKNTRWDCLCTKCGKVYSIISTELRIGATLQCKKCHNKIKSLKFTEKNTRHNKSKTRLYKIWLGIKARIKNENGVGYKYYGGKGITMSIDWQNNYNAFEQWAMANGYNDNLTIDRIDNDLGYFPENCRWATMEEQANNTSRNVLIEYNGETKTMSEWCKFYNIKYLLAYKRLKRGWSHEKAFTTPTKKD